MSDRERTKEREVSMGFGRHASIIPTLKELESMKRGKRH